MQNQNGNSDSKIGSLIIGFDGLYFDIILLEYEKDWFKSFNIYDISFDDLSAAHFSKIRYKLL